MANPEDLAGIPLFAGLDEDERTELAPWFEERSVGAGVRICGEGTVGYSFFVLVDGSADVASGNETLGQLRPGDFFGEVAILGDGRRSATVTTTAPSKVLTMFGTEFRRLQSAQPAVAESIVETMRARIAARGAAEPEPSRLRARSTRVRASARCPRAGRRARGGAARRAARRSPRG